MRRSTLLTALAVVGVAAAGAAAWFLLPREPAGPNVVFMVLDTVRADHLSACGYARPTTPTLEALVDDGASLTCDAWAPASWTLPSHASFFTGVGPEAHHAHSITSGIKSYDGVKARARKLHKDLPTLAERMDDAGFRTALVSANPVVGPGLGLSRGFGYVDTCKDWGDCFGDDLTAMVRTALDEAWEPGERLFLFVNIADAHQPWDSVPSGALDGALQRRPGLHYSKTRDDSKWQRFIEGGMEPDEAERFESRVVDTYDYGIWRADQVLAGVLAELEAREVCAPGCRFVLTSDHGEFVGERNLLDHGNYVWEGMIRVPLMTWGVDVAPVDGALNAVVSHDLVRTGALVEAPLQSLAWPHARRCRALEGKAYCGYYATVRDGDRKVVWSDDGAVIAFDLASDPAEERPLAVLPDDPVRARVTALGQVVLDDARDDDVDPDVLEALRAAGYME